MFYKLFYSFLKVLSSYLTESTRVKKKNTVDGLSVERLTLLGRVHVARVTIDSLQIAAELDSSTSKPKPKSRYGLKPPKPSPKGKKTW